MYVILYFVNAIGVDAKTGQRLGAPHATQTGGDGDGVFQRAVEVFLRRAEESFVGALEDALGADVDPGARGHLSVHHQPCAIEAVELLPIGPVGNEIGVGDEDAWCQRMRF